MGVDYSQGGKWFPALSEPDIDSRVSPSPFGSVYPLKVLARIHAGAHWLGRQKLGDVVTDKYAVSFKGVSLTHAPAGLHEIADSGETPIIWLDRHGLMRQLIAGYASPKQGTLRLYLTPHAPIAVKRPPANQTCVIRRP